MVASVAMVTGMTGLAGAQHRGQLFRLDADDADVGVGFLERAGHAADQATAADGDDDGFKVGNLVEQFQADGALAADDLGIVKGMDEGSALFDAAAQGFIAGFVVAGAEQNHFGSVAARGGHFDLRRGQGHDDLRLDAARGSVESDTLGVVPGTGGNHPALALGFAQREQLVQRAALLERAGSLQVFKLQVQRQSGQLREMMRKLARRDVNGFADAGAGRLDAGE